MNVQDSIQQLWAVNPANVLLIGGLAFFAAGCFKKTIQGESQRGHRRLRVPIDSRSICFIRNEPATIAGDEQRIVCS